jgi:hypothetical protein
MASNGIGSGIQIENGVSGSEMDGEQSENVWPILVERSPLIIGLGTMLGVSRVEPKHGQVHYRRRRICANH